MNLHNGSVFYLVGIVNCLFFSLLLLTIKKGNIHANRWLASFFVALSVCLIEVILEYAGYFFQYPHLAEVLMPFSFALGPLYFFYTKALTHPKFGWNRKVIFHFIPFLLCYVVYLPLFVSSKAEKLNYLKRLYADQPTPYDWVNYLALFFYLLYNVAGFVIVMQHQKRVKSIFSTSLEQVNLVWLKRFSICLFVIWIVWGNFHFLDIQLLKQLTPAIFICLFFSLGFFAIKQNNIFATPEIISSFEQEIVESKTKPSAIQPDKKEELKDGLVRLMEKEKLFLENELALPDLAKKLCTSTNVLSELINKEFESNFYEFVNRYRVEEAKMRLLDEKYQHLTIFSIALDSGFNSKSTFNAVFKNKVGLTPSEYRKKHKAPCPKEQVGRPIL